MVGGRIVVHRIAYRRRLRRAGGFFITRGDAMILPDVPIDTASVLGRVVEFGSNGCWRPVGPRARRARRERLVSLVVLAASAVLLEISPSLAGRFVAGLADTNGRLAWIRMLL
jgi:hypothetical protein